MRDYSPEALRRQSEEFWVRVKRDTPKLRKEFEAAHVDGVKVVNVGDIEWWPQTDATILLAAVQLENGAYLALGYADGKFEMPEASKFSWALDNLTALPKLKLDDDCIAVWFADERYIMAEHGCPNEEYRAGTPRLRWRYTGIGSSGSTALKAFAKHGMTFSADFTPRK
ncbi:MAG: hypothetical protein AAB964_02315 [Patescibacteria group bacterium]